MWLRRFVVIGGAVALTIAGAHEMYLVFAVNGVTPLAIFILALFLALFAWIALSFTSALAGFCSMLAGGGCRLGTGPMRRCPARVEDRAADADLQRAAGARHGGAAGDLGVVARNRRGRSVRPVHPQRHHRRRHLDRGGGRLPGAARTNGRTGADILPSPSAERRAQVGQHRGLGDALRRSVCAVPDPRRRQSDDR